MSDGETRPFRPPSLVYHLDTDSVQGGVSQSRITELAG